MRSVLKELLLCKLILFQLFARDIADRDADAADQQSRDQKHKVDLPDHVQLTGDIDIGDAGADRWFILHKAIGVCRIAICDRI